MKTLNEYLDEIFSENGVVVACGGRYNKEQAQYAKSIAYALENEGFNALEAETGIGKSIGYLTPAMLYLALNPESPKIVVSTFTRLLQKQMITKDVPFVNKMLEAVGLQPIHVALRMGRGSFFSMERTVRHVQEKTIEYPQHKAIYEKFLLFAHTSCASGSGIWLDWFDLGYESLPPYIKSQDICLLQFQSVDNPAYEMHKENANNCALLITNHATMANFFKDEIKAVFFDESHEIEKTYEELFTKKLQFSRMQQQYQYAIAILGKRLNREVITLIESLINKARSLDEKSEYITNPDTLFVLNDEIKRLYEPLSKLKNLLESHFSQKSASTEEAECYQVILHSCAVLSKWGAPQKYSANVLGFSDIRRIPSIAVIQKTPASLFALKMNKITKHVVLTSATISDLSPNLSFRSLGFALGIREFIQQKAISPEHYGDLDFVIAERNTPKPTKADSSEFTFDADWLLNTVNMIKYAKKSGAVLVLTASFGENEVLCDLLRSQGIEPIEHVKGTSVIQYLGEFKKGKRILVSPGAWEGVSVVGKDGEQLFSNLVITRLPIRPTFFLMKSLNFYTWMDECTKVVTKMRQGIGRIIRGPNFKGTIYIADPRMPSLSEGHPKSDYAVLVHAIPKRFRAQYTQAKVFNSKTSKPEEIRKIVMV